jgi:hypothetical protein
VGAVSAAGTFVNAATGAVIAPPVTTTVGSAAGTGPLNFPETITISGAQVETWRAAGVRVVGYRRIFAAPGSPTVSAQWLLRIRAAGLAGSRESLGGELVIQRMDLDFTGGKRVAIVERGSELVARASITYSGSGTLRGRWEISDPGSQGADFFRVLMLVREPLGGGKSITLESPRLPTQVTGRHVLRFCVETTESCANSATTVQTFYEVTAGEVAALLRGLTPDHQPLRPGGEFRWPAVAGATTWQLQIFAPAVANEDEPRFVTGMLLPGGDTRARVSRLVREKLHGGQTYLWRVTAHDAEGHLLAGGALARFTWRP